MVTGVFNSRESADKAYMALQGHGYTSDQIHLIMSDDTHKTHFTHDVVSSGSRTLSGTGAGAAIGGTVGAVAAAIAAVGSNLVVPGLGLVVAGPIVAALAGAGAGGAAGSLVGALVGAGIPEERAVIYERDLNHGHIVLGVHAHSAEEAKDIENELRLYDAHDIHR